jgi:hypothetical protein
MHVLRGKKSARAWIVLGFGLSAIGTFVSMIVLISHGYLGMGQIRADLQLFVVPLASLAAWWAWLLLSKIATIESDHAPLFQGAFFGLMFQSLGSGVTYVNILWTSHELNQYTISLWLQTIGAFAAALGFVQMAHEFSNGRTSPEQV